ncbi:hypothetical protein M1O57_00155 [Dehalococcoidia bacterium]|nr:hypothetical protein [Dehalococcoidia bacterium]
MIPVCQPDDKARIYFIISEAAKAYEGVILSEVCQGLSGLTLALQGRLEGDSYAGGLSQGRSRSGDPSGMGVRSIKTTCLRRALVPGDDHDKKSKVNT